jgi:hypothetical protein
MDINNRIEKANNIINSLPESFIKKNKGKFAAVEIQSGDYFIGNTEWEAYQLAIKKFPDHKFVFVRIGAEAAHFVGAECV